MCALDRYQGHLEALEGLDLSHQPASALKWGQNFDRYRVAVWESLARQGYVVRKEPLIGGTGEHVYKLPDTDRYEIWVEKQFIDLDGKKWRGDNVIFDLEAKRAVMTDITSRSPDDPVVLGRFRLRFEGEGALEHDATNRLRAKALQDLVRQKRPDLGEIRVDPVTPEGYRTFTERQMSERRSTARSRLGGRGPGPATAFIASIIVSMVVSNLVTPAEAKAMDTSESDHASQTLAQMVSAYASGDLDTARQLRSQWDDGLAGLMWVNGLPLPSDLNRVKLLEQIGAQLDKMDLAARGAYACRQICRRANEERVRRLRNAEATLASATDQVRQQYDKAFADIDSRIERWRADLRPLLARKGTTDTSPTWGYVKWDEVESVISAQSALQSIRQTQKEGEDTIKALSAGDLDLETARQRIQRLVGYALYDYWWQFAVGAVNWVHHGIRQEQVEAIQALAKEYDAAQKDLEARKRSPSPEDYASLDRSFRSREEPITARLASRYRALYDRFAAETLELATAIRSLGDVDNRAPELFPGGDDWKLMNQDSYVFSTNVWYHTQAIRVPTQYLWAAESFKNVLPPDSDTNIASITAWINGIQVDLAALTSVREGSRLAFWGGSFPKDSPPPPPDWPLGPPPATSHAPGRWSLEAAKPPGGAGPVFNAEAPLLQGKPARSSVLHFTGDKGAELSKPMTFTPNSPPEICVEVSDTREKLPTVVSWHITDADPYDSIQWSVSIDGLKEPIKGAGMRRASGSRIMTWDKAGNYKIRVAADDGLDSREATYSVKVEGNHPPTITAGMVVSALNHVHVGEPFEVKVAAKDPDPGDDLRFVLNTPKGVVGLGEESCEPWKYGWTCLGLARADMPGRYTIRATVRDDSDASDTMTFDVIAEE